MRERCVRSPSRSSPQPHARSSTSAESPSSTFREIFGLLRRQRREEHRVDVRAARHGSALVGQHGVPIAREVQVVGLVAAGARVAERVQLHRRIVHDRPGAHSLDRPPTRLGHRLGLDDEHHAGEVEPLALGRDRHSDRRADDRVDHQRRRVPPALRQDARHPLRLADVAGARQRQRTSRQPTHRRQVARPEPNLPGQRAERVEPVVDPAPEPRVHHQPVDRAVEPEQVARPSDAVRVQGHPEERRQPVERRQRAEHPLGRPRVPPVRLTKCGVTSGLSNSQSWNRSRWLPRIASDRPLNSSKPT